ncbi:MAG: hypothetical protein AAF993_04210 [Pseudomonadota bacterium]
MDWLLTHLAMALDTLPLAGRVMLLAGLLSLALAGLARRLLRPDADDGAITYQLIYLKGALVTLLLVPALVYLTGFKLPVHVTEFTQFHTTWPADVALGLLFAWLLGVVYHLWLLGRAHQAEQRVLAAVQVLQDKAGAETKLQSRATHWCQRLRITHPVTVLSQGGEQPWHLWRRVPHGLSVEMVIVLPAAARNWPVGVVDSALTRQLAQSKQGVWSWLLFARLVQAVYWPMPWVAGLGNHLKQRLQVAGNSLAAAAYRDPSGWRRDLQNYRKRAETLASGNFVGNVLRLSINADAVSPAQRSFPANRAANSTAVPAGEPTTFENRWARSKAHLRDKYRSPYEQAYWLIAVACVAVSLATTLTIVQAPPEFDPQFLELKWQDGLARRLHDQPLGPEGVPAAGGSAAPAGSGDGSGRAAGAAAQD